MSEPERVRALLDERSAALARRGLVERATVETAPFLVCTCGSERYGLALADVAAVMAAKICTPLPGAPAMVRGVAALSGTLVTVLDLGPALGLERGETPPESGHFVRLRSHTPPIVLAVDRVLGIVEIETALVGRRDPGDLGGEAVSGYAPPASAGDGDVGTGLAIVDLPRLLGRLPS